MKKKHRKRNTKANSETESAKPEEVKSPESSVDDLLDSAIRLVDEALHKEGEHMSDAGGGRS